jgi:hypothetical protein
VSRAGGRPLSGATLTLIAPDGRQAGRASAGPDGGYRIGVADPGSYTLIAMATGHQPYALAVQAENAVQTVADVELRGGTRVAGAARTGWGDSVPDARVTLLDDAGSVIAVAATGPDGSYAFENVAEGEYTVIASGYPPAASRILLEAGESHSHDVVLGHPGV